MAESKEQKERSFARRDRLIEIELNAQKEWEAAKAFELDAPEDGETKCEKYLATFPYPYMNGMLHLGHAFTLSKAEFQIGYQRLKGKRALFPFGFHCTGMPIAACADKLKREIALYGNPPVFPAPPAPEESSEAAEADTKDSQEEAPAAAAAAAPAASKPKKKNKVASKKSTQIYQWNIMKEMGVPDELIANFQDPVYWLHYFPPLAKDDLKRFGLKADFRRSFITTDVNPYYDAFIRWHFNQLRARDKVAFGNRACVFSPLDDQACADHDRATGEGVGPQEYTIIKLRVTAFPENCSFKSDLAGKNVFLAAATLRPETMYGQTNCWVLPTGNYGAYQMNNDEVWICSHRSALNMSYQNLMPVRGQPQCLAEMTGQELIGSVVQAPNATYSGVYVLPLLTVSMEKTTGVVTSVPSDAPDDYAALMDLKNKPALRQKYGVTDEMVLPFNIVEIINIPGYGNQSAVEVCNQLGIKSQNDRDKLAEAKDRVYLKGFTEGVMLVGDYAGRKVSEAKPLIRQQMISQGTAGVYFEPESQVISRSGCECVVAFTDQWYMKYGEEKWQEQVRNHVDNVLETFGAQAKSKFQYAVDWLKEWACSRTYGLGTRLPWDPTFLIESLSDSTIYMAYYTIAHILQEGEMDGQAEHPIRAEQLTDAVFDYIFLDGALPETTIPQALLDKMKAEFKFWYPLDLRVSGKDLIPNHLTMALYNHAAIWEDPAMMPRAFFTNGHVMINGAKMSKSTGNFLTLRQCFENFGVDATRFALADAGDTLEDANFSTQSTNAGILRLTREADWIEEILQSIDSLRTGPYNFYDRAFDNDINRAVHLTDSAYARMQFRESLLNGLFDLSINRDAYRVAASTGMHRDVVLKYIEVQLILLSPICPHITEYLWKKLGKDTLIVNARWPVVPLEDPILTRQSRYLQQTAREVRLKHQAAEANRVKKIQAAKKKDANAVVADEPFTRCVVSVAAAFPDWQQQVLVAMSQEYNAETKAFNRELTKAFGENDFLKRNMKKVMPFASAVKEDLAVRGPEAFELRLPFDEFVFLSDHKEFVVRGLGLQNVEVVAQVPGGDEKEQASPGKPNIRFF